MSNLADFIKHNGLVKISGPKKATYYKPGQIDMQEGSDKLAVQAFVYR